MGFSTTEHHFWGPPISGTPPFGWWNHVNSPFEQCLQYHLVDCFYGLVPISNGELPISARKKMVNSHELPILPGEIPLELPQTKTICETYLLAFTSQYPMVKIRWWKCIQSRLEWSIPLHTTSLLASAGELVSLVFDGKSSYWCERRECGNDP